MSQKRKWTADVRHAGWARRDYGTQVVIGVTLAGGGPTPNLHVGRVVDVELTPALARWLAANLVSYADDVDGGLETIWSVRPDVESEVAESTAVTLRRAAEKLRGLANATAQPQQAQEPAQPPSQHAPNDDASDQRKHTN